MTNQTDADDDNPATEEWTEQRVREVWQHAGGAFFAGGKENATMPAFKLVRFLRALLEHEGIAPRAQADAAAPAPAGPKDPEVGQLRDVLLALCEGILPGRNFPDVMQAALEAARALEFTAPAGIFHVVKTTRTDDGVEVEVGRIVQVDVGHERAADAFPLYRRARIAGEGDHAAAPAAAPATPSKRK